MANEEDFEVYLGDGVQENSLPEAA
ncbi:MAG: hypothetical protein RL172_1786, partial [Bacteroidota bacterium]